MSEACKCGRVRLSFVDEREPESEALRCERCGCLVPVVVMRVDEQAEWQVVLPNRTTSERRVPTRSLSVSGGTSSIRQNGADVKMLLDKRRGLTYGAKGKQVLDKR